VPMARASMVARPSIGEAAVAARAAKA
jgi:hypothetical protein